MWERQKTKDIKQPLGTGGVEASFKREYRDFSANGDR